MHLAPLQAHGIDIPYFGFQHPPASRQVTPGLARALQLSRCTDVSSELLRMVQECARECVRRAGGGLPPAGGNPEQWEWEGGDWMRATMQGWRSDYDYG